PRMPPAGPASPPPPGPASPPASPTSRSSARRSAVRQAGQGSRMRGAVVDVGANTARVLVADVFRDGRVEAVEERRERLGLGAEIAARGALSRDTVGVVARACK